MLYSNLLLSFLIPKPVLDWWVMYPYGKWVLDDQLMGQAGRETQANFAFDFPYFGYRYNYTFVSITTYAQRFCNVVLFSFIDL